MLFGDFSVKCCLVNSEADLIFGQNPINLYCNLYQNLAQKSLQSTRIFWSVKIPFSESRWRLQMPINEKFFCLILKPFYVQCSWNFDFHHLDFAIRSVFNQSFDVKFYDKLGPIRQRCFCIWQVFHLIIGK